MNRIEKAESCLIDMGFECVRVRSCGSQARIEVEQEERSKFFSETVLDRVPRALKENRISLRGHGS